MRGELHSITDRLLEPKGSVRKQIHEIRTFALGWLSEIRKRLSDREKNVLAARTALAEGVGKITLKPVRANGRMVYTANGNANLLQGAAARFKCAGGRNLTVLRLPAKFRFCVRRKAA